MEKIYRVSIHGRVLENCDLRKLLASAVREKRNMDRVFHSDVKAPQSSGAVFALQAQASEERPGGAGNEIGR